MSERRIKVDCDGGLHENVAVRLVQVAAHAESTVTIAREDEGEPVSAKNALSVLALEVEEGEEVILASEDETALDKLADVIKH